MFFNSIDFAIFLPVVFILYWFATNKNLRLQNLLIVVASYFFYGSWDWRFLSLIILSTTVDYLVGIGLSNQKQRTRRKLLLLTSIVVNLGMLGFFKYYNFFQANFIKAFTLLGADIKNNSLNIILPVGISFYTFQTLSYTIDVYKHKVEPTRNFIAFAAFVSFFPQLIAGPIERAKSFLPQFYKSRKFEYAKAVDGMRQILWGLFKKIVIADNCAEYANQIFNNTPDYSGIMLIAGVLFFTFQIYGDFSGYSDIAIGTSRLFGFNIMQNFAFPYFSRDIAEFWRRWHISLSTWFRDYVYIPLGGSRCNKGKQVRNIFIIFIVSGFWHGANWTFIVWGALNAFYFLPVLLTNQNRKNLNIVAKGKYLPTLRETISMLFTFVLIVFAWIIFRAENLNHAIEYITGIFTAPFFVSTNGINIDIKILLALFLIVEWLGREGKYALATTIQPLPKVLRYFTYCTIIFLMFYFSGENQEFIYFQF